MKTKLEIRPQTRLQTKTVLILKITAAVGILGMVLTGIFFAISYFGTPKDAIADNNDKSITYTNSGLKTIIISEIAFKGHNGQKQDQFIELYNFSGLAIDLSDYSLIYQEVKKNKAKTYTVNLTGTIQPEEYFVVALKNGNKDKDKPTDDLAYDLIIPSDGWDIKNDGFLLLVNGNYIYDYAGSSYDKIKKNKNYDRTDVLQDGSLIYYDWTEVHKKSSTPGALNISDFPTINSVSSAGTTVEFGSNSNTEPAVSIRSNGTVAPGDVTVKVKRGKSPASTIQMIKRSVEITPTVQPNNVQLVFYYHESELDGQVESDLALYSYYNNTWHFVGGIVDTINNKITATGVNHFSEWSAGPIGTNNANSLPISLTSFDGEFSNGSVNLVWKTATEINNDYFTIERSEDGINYEQIGTESGAGNSNTTIKYNMTDDSPFEGQTYYRLKQTDYDGKFEVFPAIAVNNNTASENLTIDNFGPNPFDNEVNIELSSDIMGPVLINIYNMQGSVIKTIEYQCQIGHNTILINDLGNLTTGTYLLKIYNDTYSTEAIRLIKK